MKFSTEELIEGIRSGNKRLIAKAITLVESKKAEHRAQAEELLKQIMPFTGNSVRVGITGVPGAGKSTFIENFGRLVIANGKKVAVLAIDPSSSINKGSILGDKTRMEELAKEENAFIRPSPSSGFLGGVANTTFETMMICEAAGYDYILIETVGVGQSEVLVSDITDVFLFLKIIGGGDELQGIKRGIMEMVDLIFINKVDQDNLQKAKNTRLELKRALDFIPPKEKGWKIPVLLGSALYNEGLDEVYTKIYEFIEMKKKNDRFHQVRTQQAEKRFEYWVQEYILAMMKRSNSVEEAYLQHKKNASEMVSNPSTEAKIFVEKFLSKD
ncbi:MAG: methylmalonyl Co-A mutase-associated GTPase MeaB [Chryseobacterium sp.]|uniref:methylmalonyl Co-A mutase-associated GTPase MeaB n=1 Tax=Chryseobacterium carnipullorum TaxID=1124835 RepID=UPI000915792A|nr:methylmalonyl Co-A mutase-associated GTPase MeaB [Chryseobacterium carnipullorum]MDN5397534.1 methylmalonyl Co-A mutase-associated GTPase MeaB [Chryseobacterium sp.]MDN5476297.1 methylmalonyl Co-A mutase-associated GTPase MeaB [Chryseobacterium sp.]MDN5480583.1 methylmalonyl Co-A mutase-associated GTPase MeaB [Chryseobacterium sp.]SHL39663.1 methylmalonyl-CoA mutase metallochaperone MeaB [Chryseobacterium carnipullorum]